MVGSELFQALDFSIEFNHDKGVFGRTGSGTGPDVRSKHAALHPAIGPKAWRTRARSAKPREFPLSGIFPARSRLQPCFCRPAKFDRPLNPIYL